MKKVILTGIALIIGIVAYGSLSSCKGRTMDNMEPTGDTVEVQISTLPDAPEDSVAGMSASEAAI